MMFVTLSLCTTMFHDMLLHINFYALPAFIFSRIHLSFFRLLFPKKRNYNNTYSSFFIHISVSLTRTYDSYDDIKLISIRDVSKDLVWCMIFFYVAAVAASFTSSDELQG